ncbi:hypothetical protein DL96DRAFT_1823469 [Flagelloscypha sp. PMI_526]|nr:hypothetical protein DL96DRAFT_1823469 [Flagelloscypha sp. PMI_526]
MTENAESPTPKVDVIPHKRFNSSDADVAIYLATNAAFPQGDHRWPEGEAAFWDEPSHVLEILFSYIYSDEPHPHLLEHSLAQVIEIGAAAHKWMIPEGIVICQMRIISTLTELAAHPPSEEEAILSAFAYAAEYHGANAGMIALIDQVAMWTVGCQVKSAMKYFGSGRVFNAWAEHRLQWIDATFIRKSWFGDHTNIRENASYLRQRSRDEGLTVFRDDWNHTETEVPVPQFTVSLARF